MKKGITALAVSAGLLIVAGCATVPEKTPAQWLGVLPAKSTMYVSLSVQPSVDMLKNALKQAGPAYNDVSTLLGMTKRLYLAVTLTPNQPSRLSAVAVGSYPAGLLSMRLGSSKDWTKKESASGTWFELAKGGLQLCVASGSAVVISTAEMQDILPRLREAEELGVPSDVAADMERSDLVMYLPELPGGVSQGSASSVHIPIQDVWLDAHKTATGYEVGGTVNLSTEKEAKLLTIVGKLVLVAWLRSQNIPNVADRLDAISVTPQGNQVILTGLSFTQDEVVPVFMSLITGAMPLPEAQQ